MSGNDVLAFSVSATYEKGTCIDDNGGKYYVIRRGITTFFGLSMQNDRSNGLKGVECEVRDETGVLTNRDEQRKELAVCKNIEVTRGSDRTAIIEL